MGLSYRKGQINYAEQNQELSKIILFERAVLCDNSQLKSLFINSEYNFYLCTHNFLSFKTLVSTQNSQIDADHLNIIPFQKLVGYADHFFHVVHEQKDSLNKFLNKQSHFKLLSKILNIALNSSVFNSSNLGHEARINALSEFTIEATRLIRQIELFFKSVGKNSADLGQTNLIGSSYQAINAKIEELKNHFNSATQNPLLDHQSSEASYYEDDLVKDECLLEKLKFNFMDDSALNEALRCFSQENSLNACLIDLNQVANTDCKPFAGVFEQLKDDLVRLGQFTNVKNFSVKLFKILIY